MSQFLFQQMCCAGRPIWFTENSNFDPMVVCWYDFIRIIGLIQLGETLLTEKKFWKADGSICIYDVRQRHLYFNGIQYAFIHKFSPVLIYWNVKVSLAIYFHLTLNVCSEVFYQFEPCFNLNSANSNKGAATRVIY